MSDGEVRATPTVRGWLSLVAVGLLAALVPPLVAATLPALSPGYTSTVVASGSMAPAIRTGDVVVTRAPTADHKIGAPAVVLHRPVGTDRLVLHRVVGLDESGRYLTRGDANRTLDVPVPAHQVVGVGALVVPLVGTPLLWFDEGRHLALLVLLLSTGAAIHLARTPRSGAARVWRRRLPGTAVGRRLAAGGLATAFAGATLLGPVAAIDRSAAAFADITTASDNHLQAADRTAPTVTMDDPGQALTGTATLSAQADDEHAGVDHVTFSSASVDTDTWTEACTAYEAPWSCTYDTAQHPPGGYQLRAVAVDGVGNDATSPALETTFSLPVFAGLGPEFVTTTSGPATVDYPTGTQTDDLLLLLVTNTADRVSTPSGDWTLLVDGYTAETGRYGLWWRRADAASETTLDAQVHPGGGGSTVSARIVRYLVPPGRDPVVEAHGTFPRNAAPAEPTVTPGSVTTDAAATAISIVAIMSDNQLEVSTPRGFTERAVTTGSPHRLGFADQTVPRATTPASPTWTQTGTPVAWAWTTIAFR